MQFEACLELRLHGHLRIDPRWVQLPAPVRKVRQGEAFFVFTLVVIVAGIPLYAPNFIRSKFFIYFIARWCMLSLCCVLFVCMHSLDLGSDCCCRQHFEGAHIARVFSLKYASSIVLFLLF